MRYREVRPGMWVEMKGNDYGHFRWGEVIGKNDGDNTLEVNGFDVQGNFTREIRVPAFAVWQARPSSDFRTRAVDSLERHRRAATPATTPLPTTSGTGAGGERMIPESVVVRVAKKYADRHNMCGVIDEALSEMGITTVPKWRLVIDIQGTKVTNTSMDTFRSWDTGRQLRRLRASLDQLSATDYNNITVTLEEVPGAHGRVGTL